MLLILLRLRGIKILLGNSLGLCLRWLSITVLTMLIIFLYQSSRSLLLNTLVVERGMINLLLWCEMIVLFSNVQLISLIEGLEREISLVARF